MIVICSSDLIKFVSLFSPYTLQLAKFSYAKSVVRIERTKQATFFKLVKFVDLLFRKRLTYSFQTFELPIYSISWEIQEAFSHHSQAGLLSQSLLVYVVTNQVGPFTEHGMTLNSGPLPYNPDIWQP